MMADPLYELLTRDELVSSRKVELGKQGSNTSTTISRYLSRLQSLKLSDLTTTEPESLQQASHSNLLSIQALSSRSNKSTTLSADQLANLSSTLPDLNSSAESIKSAIPTLDRATTGFASKYSRARNIDSDEIKNTSQQRPHPLDERKQTLLLSAQADSLQDIIELPDLLKHAVRSAGLVSTTSSAGYTQALDLYAHIKRLQILYPGSQLIVGIQEQADEAMKEMTTNLLKSLQSQNIRLAAAIRTIGWLRRVLPELGGASIIGQNGRHKNDRNTLSTSSFGAVRPTEEDQDEGSYGALFLAARLSTFLSLTEDALAPLRDLADQESQKRLQSQHLINGSSAPQSQTVQPSLSRRSSTMPASSTTQGQQTERYLKRYIEIFREHSFSTIQMYRNIFPIHSTRLRPRSHTGLDETTDASATDQVDPNELVRLPSALSSFPIHLINLLMETLQTYLPNVTNSASRESLLIQVLYAANSLGRLGADFSMMISLLDLPGNQVESGSEEEPEWYRVMKKHRVQAARLDRMARGVDETGSGSLTREIVREGTNSPQK